MIGSWGKRLAMVTTTAVLLLTWPQTAKEADVLAASNVAIAPAAVESEKAGAAAVSVEKAVAAEEPPQARAAQPPEETPTPAAAPMRAEPPAAAESSVPPQAAPSEPIEEKAADPREVYARLAAGDRTGGDLGEKRQYAAPEQPTVYLTFDDGPSKWTPKVLDILKEYEVPATFFVLGSLAEQQEETVRRIVREGHALGNHTYDHTYKNLYGSFASFWEQVQRTDDILERIAGEPVTLLRAPGGTASNFDAFYFYYLEKAGYSVHDWNVDSGDSRRKGVPAAEIVANVKRAKLTHEMNVLLHDGAGHEESVKALPDIIRYFKDKGYRFAALSEDVKPIAFRVGKPKWSRNVDAKEHERLLALVEAGASRAGPDDTWVPLRTWAGEAGAAVAWDAEAETARVVIGGTTVEWNVRTKSGRAIGADGRASSIAFVFELKNERLYVPRAAVEAYLQDGGGVRTASVPFAQESL
ncbi:polysaccharide deacetylase [Paenibacillus sp.]|uniref:polysaccharide deacetylase n=1 Tax=Paenibacillus sp. TaxID=58172 RepID=UPI002D5AECF0|nr:polysaccharide deacetylase family protein [Paenibacillus sp.]HZG88417.1 polysaccharide deacetylase family protein [Paenibacillus sp.]